MASRLSTIRAIPCVLQLHATLTASYMVIAQFGQRGYCRVLALKVCWAVGAFTTIDDTRGLGHIQCPWVPQRHSGPE